MQAMKMGWGWKIAVLYTGFAGMILLLVVSSVRQDFDLVSENYYDDEIKYQNVIDAGKNQAGLSAAMAIHANGSQVVIEFPDELSKGELTGKVSFYSPVNAAWDKSFDIAMQSGSNRMAVPRVALQNTRYIVKISCALAGKDYYQESEIQLHD